MKDLEKKPHVSFDEFKAKFLYDIRTNVGDKRAQDIEILKNLGPVNNTLHLAKFQPISIDDLLLCI